MAVNISWGGRVRGQVEKVRFRFRKGFDQIIDGNKILVQIYMEYFSMKILGFLKYLGMYTDNAQRKRSLRNLTKKKKTMTPSLP